MVVIQKYFTKVASMKPNIELQEENKLDIIKFLIGENNKELVFWRERNWSALKVTVGSYVALAGVSYFKNGAYPLIFLVIGIAVLSTIYLHKNYKRYQERRDIGTRLEAALSLFENDIFIQNDSLLPSKLKMPKAAKSGSYAFIAAIWVIAVAAAAAILLS